MPDETLEEIIARMSPKALSMYKDDLLLRTKDMSPSALTRYSTIPQLSDLFTQPEAQRELRPWEVPFAEELPMWKRALGTATMPFALAHEYIVEPFATAVTSPWSGAEWDLTDIGSLMPGGEARKAYEEWEAPKFVKGTLETLPWLLAPGAGQVAGKLGAIGAGMGRMAPLARAGAQALRPIVATEKAIAYPITKPLGMVGKKLAPKITAIERPPVVQKLTRLITEAKPARLETEALKHEELVKRVARAAGILEKGEARQAFKASEIALRGKLPKAEFTPIEKLLQGDDVTELFSIIRDSKIRYFEKLNTGTALEKLLLGEIPQQAEIGLLEKMFGSELAKSILAKRPFGARTWERVMDIANAPRAILASWDLSGLLRQGGILSTRHPIQASKTVKGMLKSFMSDKNAAIIDNQIRGRKYFNLGEQAGLYHAPLAEATAVRLTQREEMFMSRFAHFVPLVKPSERAFVTVLNDLRSRVWEQTVGMWERNGMKATMRDYKELAKLINYASGRGNLGAISSAAPLFNATLFSPRLVLSRLQLPGLLFSKSALVRKEAFQTMAAFLGAGTSILALLKFSGAAEVELDPRSADFGKAKIGDTRLDFWSGYIQFERFIMQLITAQRKTQAGNITELNRREVVDRFMQTKFSPAFGLLNDILRGESYMGEEMALDTKSLSKQAFNRLVPLFIQDMAEALNQEGLVGGFIASPGLLGVGVITYTDEVSEIRDKLAEPYGVLWEQLNRETRIELEQASPELQEAMAERQKRMEGTTSGDYYSYGKSIEKSYQDAIMQKVAKVKETGDWEQFRKDVDLIAYARRAAYSTRDTEEKYADIVARYQQPLTQEQIAKMHPDDIAKRVYYEMIYADDMYDEFGEYRFEEANRRKALFVQQYGQEALDYVERLMGLKWKEPPELTMLRDARKILKPYWDIANQIWAKYPPEYKQISEQARVINKTQGEREEKRFLRRHPSGPAILFARRQIALLRKGLKLRNREVANMLQLFYSY